MKGRLVAMENKSMQVHKGGCLCGAVRYQAEGPPVVVAHCHCTACQRGSGAGHTTGAMFSLVGFHLTGQVSDYKYKSDNGNEVTKVFCPVCASPVLGRNTGMEGYVTLPLGGLDDSSSFKPQVVVFMRNQKPWDNVDNHLPSFDGQPNWKPEDGV